MKFERTPRFDNDYTRLPKQHRDQFKLVMPAFNRACEEHLADPGGDVWPTALRVTRMTSVKGVWELTWSLASPDGRATFEFVVVDGERRVRWRRIGTHRIYREP